MPPNRVVKELRRRGYRISDWEPVEDGEKWLGYDRDLKVACTVCMVTGKACVEILKPDLQFDVLGDF